MSGTYRMSEQERIHKLVRGEKEKEDGMKGILYIQRQVDFVVSDFCLGETGGQWPCTVGTIEATDLQGDALNANHAPRSLDMYAAAAARSVDSSQERKSPFFFFLYLLQLVGPVFRCSYAIKLFRPPFFFQVTCLAISFVFNWVSHQPTFAWIVLGL